MLWENILQRTNSEMSVFLRMAVFNSTSILGYVAQLKNLPEGAIGNLDANRWFLGDVIDVLRTFRFVGGSAAICFKEKSCLSFPYRLRLNPKMLVGEV